MDIIALIILCLIDVESGGDDSKIGDNGRAYGALQITQGVLDDINKWYHKEFVLEDMKIRENAVWVCRKYLEHYCSHGRLGHPPSAEELAKTWQGGPRWYDKPEHLQVIYEERWRRVRNLLELKLNQ